MTPVDETVEFWSTLAQWTGLLLPVCSIGLVLLLSGRLWRYWKWMLILLALSISSALILWKMLQAQRAQSAAVDA